MRDDDRRIVMTGVGLAAPNGSGLPEFRRALLDGKSGVVRYNIRHVGETVAGVCGFDALRHQNRKDLRVGTRVGSISIFCANEAVADSGMDWASLDKSRCGVYVGITEHGNVETENEIHNISQFGMDVKFWTHHHNPRTVANNPAGETTINMGITGPHYCVGGACAAGNLGIIQGAQQLMLGEVDVAIAGGASESIHTFGIFAGFKSQNSLASHADPAKASRPFDLDRNGIVISEGGCLFVLERLSDARRRGANILAEILGWAVNSDADNTVLPSAQRQAQCLSLALRKSGLEPDDVDLVNTHATGTKMGDIQECLALKEVFSGCQLGPHMNNTKGFIGHAMGAAGSIELAGNLPSLQDGVVHHCLNVDRLDPECEMRNLVLGAPVRRDAGVRVILNNSFGMLGINSVLVVGRRP